MVRLSEILTQAAAKEKSRAVPKRLIAHTDFRRQVRELLASDATPNKAAGLLTKALVCHPECLDGPEFYTDKDILALASETSKRLKNVDMDKIEHFYRLYGLEDAGQKAGTPKGRKPPPAKKRPQGGKQ